MKRVGNACNAYGQVTSLLRVRRRWVVRRREDRALLDPGGRVMPVGRRADWALANRPPRGNAVTLAVRLPAGDVPRFGAPPDRHPLVPTYTFVRDGKDGKVDWWVLPPRARP